jgi:hypothetical protein
MRRGHAHSTDDDIARGNQAIGVRALIKPNGIIAGW